MKHLVFLLEEKSSQTLLDILIPRFFNNVNHQCISFDGKQDLEKHLVKTLKGYNIPNSSFIIVRDQDSGDCLKIKSNLQDLCMKGGCKPAIIRIACRELESWYFGDLAAVSRALEIPKLESYAKKSKYRNPDSIVSPKSELKKITNFAYQQVSSSRLIAKYMSKDSNSSHSFNILLKGVEKLIES